MSQWTDEQLSDRLREAFVKREIRADPDVARRIAAETSPSPSPLNRWPILAAVAVVLVVVVVTLKLFGAGDDAKPAPMLPAVRPTPAGHNFGVAQRAAARIFRAAPVPPGAERQGGPPAKYLDRLRLSGPDIDPALSRTGFWVLPMSRVELVEWYAAHSPADPATTVTSDSSVPVPESEMFWDSSKPTAAFTQPVVIVAYSSLGPRRTGLRIDVVLASRFDRTEETLVPPTQVTSATITQTPEGNTSPKETVTVSDPVVLAALGSAYNRALGDAAGSGNGPCGMPTDGRDYAVTFHWPGHSLQVTKGMPLCRFGRDLILDGVRLPEMVSSEDPALARALAHAYAAGQ